MEYSRLSLEAPRLCRIAAIDMPFTGLVSNVPATQWRGQNGIFVTILYISAALSDICLAFATSFVLYLMIEAPFRNIFAVLLAPPETRQ
ncbi:hypothetical protein NQ317_015545 [Molorchus minor]|uniref:Uncharacterized protein n=1 Tax=Molorchus minor TaxID=1323400 RepID=A0ABQ9JPB8_9CUCU|nr:hypothetical protein NQ317_015545 [Molorchus minor]